MGSSEDANVPDYIDVWENLQVVHCFQETHHVPLGPTNLHPVVVCVSQGRRMKVEFLCVFGIEELEDMLGVPLFWVLASIFI